MLLGAKPKEDEVFSYYEKRVREVKKFIESKKKETRFCSYIAKPAQVSQSHQINFYGEYD